jgi:purine-binding chemotaxis protein CheW
MSTATLADSPRSGAARDGLVGLVVFRLDRERYALPLTGVERIVRAVEVTLLPKAPAIVDGVIDLAGQVIPVLNMRRRFGLPERELHPDDHFIIARAGSRTVALVIDDAQGVVELPRGAIVKVESIAPQLQHVRGVIQLPDGLVLIQDLEQFLSLDEARALDTAMDGGKPRAG